MSQNTKGRFKREDEEQSLEALPSNSSTESEPSKKKLKITIKYSGISAAQPINLDPVLEARAPSAAVPDVRDVQLLDGAQGQGIVTEGPNRERLSRFGADHHQELRDAAFKLVFDNKPEDGAYDERGFVEVLLLYINILLQSEEETGLPFNMQPTMARRGRVARAKPAAVRSQPPRRAAANKKRIVEVDSSEEETDSEAMETDSEVEETDSGVEANDSEASDGDMETIKTTPVKDEVSTKLGCDSQQESLSNKALEDAKQAIYGNGETITGKLAHCICREAEGRSNKIRCKRSGMMIRCYMDGQGCPYGADFWFHFECVDLAPKEKISKFWVCPMCIQKYTIPKFGVKRALEDAGYPATATDEHAARFEFCEETFNFGHASVQRYMEVRESRYEMELRAEGKAANAVGGDSGGQANKGSRSVWRFLGIRPFRQDVEEELDD